MAAALIGHVEIPAFDIEKSKEFYSQLFGWDLKAFGNGYLLFNSHLGTTVGLKKVDEIAKGNTTIFHVNVEDIDLYLKKAEELGGSVARGKTVIPVYGYYALIHDINGNTIGLYQTH